MLAQGRGSIFLSNAEAYVCPVNCKGVMGAGLARDFRERYRTNYLEYRARCNRNLLMPGSVFTVRSPGMEPEYIINFPTKLHWRDPSRIGYIENGIHALAAEVNRIGLESVAVPGLGCGLGGLDWKAVRPLLVAMAEGPLADVLVEIYSPQ